jgi:hypothetical protein
MKGGRRGFWRVLCLSFAGLSLGIKRRVFIDSLRMNVGQMCCLLVLSVTFPFAGLSLGRASL